VDLSLKTGSDLGMSARVIQVRTATRRLRSLQIQVLDHEWDVAEIIGNEDSRPLI